MRLYLHVGVAELQPVGHGCAACCHEHAARFHRRFLALSFVDYGARSDALHGCLHDELHAFALHSLAQALGNVAVDGRQALLEKLYHRNLAAKSVHHRGKLHAYHTGSDNRQPFGNSLEAEHLGGCENVGQGYAVDGRHLRLRPRSDDDVPGSVFGAVAYHGVVVLEACAPSDEGYARLCEQLFHSASELLHHRVLVVCSLCKILFGKRGGMTESLGRYASAVETGASGLRTFKNSHSQTVLSSVVGSPIAARSATYYNKVATIHNL